MNSFGGARKLALIAIAALAIVLTMSLPSQARGAGGPGVGGGHPGGAVGHGGFDGHHGFDGHRGFDGHHGFDGHGFVHQRFGFAPVFPFYGTIRTTRRPTGTRLPPTGTTAQALEGTTRMCRAAPRRGYPCPPREAQFESAALRASGQTKRG
jgi:hypothetical protein